MRNAMNTGDNAEQASEKQNEVVNIPIDRLEPTPFRNRYTAELEDLAKTLQRTGIETPLTVIALPDREKYEILTGDRTYCAASFMHEKDSDIFATIPCTIKKQEDISEDEIQSVFDQITDAKTNKDGYRLDVIEHVIRLCGTTIKKSEMKKRMAKAFVIKNRYVSMYWAIVEKASEDLKNAVRGNKNSGHITASLAVKILLLPDDVQGKIIQRVNNGVNATKAYKAETEKLKSEMERQFVRDAKTTKSWTERMIKYSKTLDDDQIKALQSVQNLADYICVNGLGEKVVFTVDAADDYSE